MQGGMVTLQLLQVSLLFLLFWLLDRGYGKRYPHWAALLWLVWVLKCLTPPIVAAPTSLFSLAQLRVDQVPFGAANGHYISQPLARLQFDVPGWLGNIGVILWLIGFVIVGYHLVRRLHQCQRVVQNSQPNAALQTHCDAIAGRLGISEVAVRVCDTDFGPAVMGLSKSTIVIPSRLASAMSVPELESVLAHELLHVRRRDSWLGWLQVACSAVWWFLPLTWVVMRRLNESIERSVDVEAVSRLGLSRQSYANGLLRAVELCRSTPTVIGVPGMSAGCVTADRIENVLHSGAVAGSGARRLAGFFAAAFLCLPGAPMHAPTWSLEVFARRAPGGEGKCEFAINTSVAETSATESLQQH